MSRLTRSTAARQVQADAAHLPLASGCAYAVAVGDGPLFAAQVARIVTERAVLACAECAQHETRSSSHPARDPGDDHAAGRVRDVVESQAHPGQPGDAAPSRRTEGQPLTRKP